LKRGWTKSSLCTSAVAALVLPAAWALAQAPTPQTPEEPKRANELTLAGLRPGRDALSIALKRYNEKYSDREGTAATVKRWLDPCTGRSLSLEFDSRSMIQAITVSSLVPQEGKCADRRFGSVAVQNWVTGRGLRLGDNQDKIVELYGEPNSSGPSVNGGRELEFLYYAFDWAGADVPQVLEIHCARETGRVVEITLAFPSL
jgi:hypothetical protein